MMQSRTLTVCLLSLATALPLSVAAPAQQTRHESDRVTSAVDTQQRHALRGHLPGWAVPGGDLGVVSTDIALDQLTVVLTRSAATQAAFEQLLADQQNPSSPRYQQWLTPQQIGKQFGPTDHDVSAVTQWLASQGLRVDAVSPDRTRITFSGASSAVGRALGTEFHRYKVHTRAGDAERLSINSEPVVPAALTEVIAVFHGLSEESTEPQNISKDVPPPARALGTVTPEVTASNGAHFLAPADFVTIYDVQPEYNAGINGSGVKVAIIGQSRVKAADITAFQTNTGLSASAQPVTIIPNTGSDPGVVSSDQGEQTLDANRVMGTAPGAEADLVVSCCTSGTTSGIDISMQYEVNTLVDPIMTISYGGCEAGASSSDATFYNNLFSSAAGEGITTFVSSGDSGAAGCATAFATPPSTTPVASMNLLCSSQYVTCVGGTEFADTANPSAYWNSSNGTGLESAISYIPEGAWNEPVSGSAFQIAGTGGGVSQYITKPIWQTGTGVPADGARDTPDIALPAALHDGYYGCLNNSCAGGAFTEFAGTSAAAPAMAGIMALVVQKLGRSQGNFNPTLYRLAATTALNVFHDTTPASSGLASCSLSIASMCNNSTPSQHALTGGLAGYALTTGYDLATGLGSVDVADLVTAAAASYTLTPTSGTLTIASPGATSGNTYTITATSLNSFAGTVQLTCSVAYNSGVANNLPTCSLAPSSVTLTANSTATTVVTIQTTAVQTGSNGNSVQFIFGAGGALACMLLCFPLGRKRYRVSVLVLLLALMTMSGGLSGCGGGGTPASGTNLSNLGTTLGNYTVTVTGTFSGAATATSFTLTVN
jgi:subtilase family serine protease